MPPQLPVFTQWRLPHLVSVERLAAEMNDASSLLNHLALSATGQQLWALAADLGEATCTVAQHRTLPQAAAAAARMARGDSKGVDTAWFAAFGTVFEQPVDAAEDMLGYAVSAVGEAAAVAMIEKHLRG